MTKDGVLCHRCDTFYENPDEAFYWEERVGNYRRPCKKCIAEYNKQPDQYRKRQAANKRYQASKKGIERRQYRRAVQLKKHGGRKIKRRTKPHTKRIIKRRKK